MGSVERNNSSLYEHEPVYVLSEKLVNESA